MDWFDRQILEHVLSWAPYGGAPADETFVRFGLSLTEFHARLDTILSTVELTAELQDRELVGRVMAMVRASEPVDIRE